MQIFNTVSELDTAINANEGHAIMCTTNVKDHYRVWEYLDILATLQDVRCWWLATNDAHDHPPLAAIRGTTVAPICVETVTVETVISKLWSMRDDQKLY